MTEAERLFWQARIPLQKLVEMEDPEADRWLLEMKVRIESILEETGRLGKPGTLGLKRGR